MPAPSPERPAGALRTLTTPRAGLLPAATTKVQINPGLSLWLDEKRGSGHLLQALDGLLVVKIKRKNPKRLPQFQGVRRAAAGSKQFYPLG